jgi:hypothetical protein
LVCEADLLLTHTELVVARLEGLGSGQHCLVLSELRRRAQQVADTARSIRSAELELQAQLQLAEIADAAGDSAVADELAEDVFKRADLYRFAGLKRVAKRMIEGEDRFATRRAELERFQNDDGAGYLRNVDEGKLRGIAYESCKTFGVPTARTENLLASLMAEKLVLEDQVAWCKFLQYKERTPTLRGCSGSQLKSSYNARNWATLPASRTSTVVLSFVPSRRRTAMTVLGVCQTLQLPKLHHTASRPTLRCS